MYQNDLDEPYKNVYTNILSNDALNHNDEWKKKDTKESMSPFT